MNIFLTWQFWFHNIPKLSCLKTVQQKWGVKFHNQELGSTRHIVSSTPSILTLCSATSWIFHPLLQLPLKKKQAAAHVKLLKTLLKSLISPLHCSFYKLALVGKHETEKKNLFWHTKVILCAISSTALVKNVTSYLTVKSLLLLSPLRLSLPAACQFNLFSSAGSYPKSLSCTLSPASTNPQIYSFTHWPSLQHSVLMTHSYPKYNLSQLKTLKICCCVLLFSLRDSIFNRGDTITRRLVCRFTNNHSFSCKSNSSVPDFPVSCWSLCLAAVFQNRLPSKEEAAWI